MTADQQKTSLSAGWLNAWLGAIGALRLLPEARLGWAGRGTPQACFTGLDIDLATALAQTLPNTESIDRLVIARHRPGLAELARKVPRIVYQERARLARSLPADGSLSGTQTDLVKGDETGHGPFDPVMPKGLTIAERLRTCRERLPTSEGALAGAIAASLAGRGARTQANGLGFDVTRAAAGVYGNSDVMVDPVVECLAFEGIQLFPVRGDGGVAPLQRGFVTKPSRRRALQWPAWSQPLDLWAFDALFDQFTTLIRAVPLDVDIAARPQVVAGLHRLGITAVYGSVYQQARSVSDTYRAYGAERLW